MAVACQAEPIIIKNKGMRMFGVFHPPLGVKKGPAVAILHGFGGNKCGKHRMYVNIARALAEMGIGSVRVDYRACGDSDGTWKDMTVHGQVDDTLMILNYLAKRPEVDPTHIGVLGRSFGGAVALMAAAKYQKLKSMALWAPVFTSDQWRLFWDAHKDQVEAMGEHAALPFQGELVTPTFVEEFFALDLCDALSQLQHVPLLHVHGGEDTVVNPDHSEGYRRCRQEAKAETKFIMLEKCDHDFTDPYEQQRLMADTAAWFQMTLCD